MLFSAVSPPFFSLRLAQQKCCKTLKLRLKTEIMSGISEATYVEASVYCENTVCGLKIDLFFSIIIYSFRIIMIINKQHMLCYVSYPSYNHVQNVI